MPRFHLPDHLKQVRLAWRNIARQRRRTALALITVSGGIVAFLLSGGFIAWVLNGMAETTIHSQLGHLQITRPGYFEAGLRDPYKHLLPPTVPASVDRLEGLVTVSPRLAFSGLLSKGDETVSFIGEGGARNRATNQSLDQYRAGRRALRVGRARGVAWRWPRGKPRASPGDTVVLLASTADGGINAVELTVAGIFATISKAYDDVVLRAPIRIARELMRVDGSRPGSYCLSEPRRPPLPSTSFSACCRTASIR